MATQTHSYINPPWEQGLFVIAEAGVNHNGDVALAKALVDAAAEAKADAVKFQTWKPGEITGKFAFKVGYLEETTDEGESRYELSNRLALPYEAFREIKAHAEKRGILFLSTPDGFDSLNFLVDDLDMPYIKIGSTEVTFPQFLEAVGSKNRSVVLSTGLSTLEEVKNAVAAIRRGGSAPLALLHCTSEYPTPDDEMNIRAMTAMADAFGLPVGLSDHSRGMEAAIAAVALGARVIEKHFTLYKSMDGPDHPASLDPAELTQFVRSLRITETMLGDGVKQPTPSELRNRTGIRRSIVAAGAIAKDTRLSEEMLACKRPGTGIPPEELNSVIGMTTTRDLSDDEPLTRNDLK